MARENYEACMVEIFRHEGAYSDHPNDPGGATNMGITHKVLAKWRGVVSVTKAQVKALTKSEARDIYRVNYWDKVRGDDLPFGIDLATMDYGVNSGVSRGVKGLQAAVGANADGRIGPDTLRRVRDADAIATIKRLCAARLSFMRSLKIWETFKRGWSRRVAEVEARGVAMWLAYAGTPAGEAAKRMQSEAEKARQSGKVKDRVANGAGAGGSVTTTGLAVDGVNWWVVVGVVVISIAVFVIINRNARHDRQRAAAYQRAALSV